ncbi:MAG: DUF6514 family protein [Clostridia bacterium]|jgi:hypothetical protein
MISYTLKHSKKILTEAKNYITVDYYLTEEFTVAERPCSYGIRLDTKTAEDIVECCTRNDISKSRFKTSGILKKLAKYNVTSASLEGILDDMLFE